MEQDDFKPLSSALATFDRTAARRAIYFDYEGIHHQDPTLLGWRIDGSYAAAVVEPMFVGCSGRYHAKAATYRDHAAAACELVGRALDEHRHLVSWSLHDPRLMHAVLPPPYRDGLRQCYVNAIKLARPWHFRKFACVPPAKARQVYFTCLFDIYVPERFGDKVVATNLRLLRALLESGTGYGAFAAEDRNRWVTVVKHNRWDLEVMDQIVKGLVIDRDPMPGRCPATCAQLPAEPARTDVHER